MDCTYLERPCTKIKYSVGKQQEIENAYESNENGTIGTIVEIEIRNELVTYVEEYFTYDLQSFIGEVGGTFEIFLGFSMISLLSDFIRLILQNYKQ